MVMHYKSGLSTVDPSTIKIDIPSSGDDFDFSKPPKF